MSDDLYGWLDAYAEPGRTARVRFEVVKMPGRGWAGYRFPRGDGDGSLKLGGSEWTVGERELLRVQMAGLLHLGAATQGLLQTAYLVATGRGQDTVELGLFGTGEAFVVLVKGVQLVSRETRNWEEAER